MAYKLVLPPDQSGYSVVDGNEVIRQQLDGGLGRYRLDILNASRIVNCQWTVGSNNYQYLRSFYNIVHRLSEPFKIDLYLDQPVLTEHDAHFIPDSMRLVSQSGLTFVVSCQLEVEPIDNEELDESVIQLVSIYGSTENVSLALDLLEKIANFDLPLINFSNIIIPPNPVPQYALVDANGNYLVSGNDNYLYGIPYDSGTTTGTFADESGGLLMDENSNTLVGEFA